MPSYNLTINGKKYAINADAQMPLLWVIRDIIGLTGTKYGCGIGQCGACTVHLNGAPIRSCQLPVSGVAGQSVTTIEGISSDNAHPVQKAWIAEQVPRVLPKRSDHGGRGAAQNQSASYGCRH